MTDTPSVVVALASVMEDVRAVRKGDRNQQQNYQFRGIDAVVNAVGPALRKHGVLVVPILEEVNYRDVQTSTGKPSRECTVKVRYRFHGPAGDYIDCVTPGESMDFGDKGAPKAMSVAYRIALLQALCLPTDDNDPDASSYERGSSRPTQQRSAPAQRQAPAERPAQATEKPTATNGHPAGPDTAEAARAALMAAAKSLSYTLPEVGKAYFAEHKTAIAQETDPVKIRQFTTDLREKAAKVDAAAKA